MCMIMKKVILVLKLNIKNILIFTLIGGLFSFVVSEYLIPKKYTAAVSMYVGFKYANPNSHVDYSVAAPNYKIYSVIIRSNHVLDKVSDEIYNQGLLYNSSELREFIEVKQIANTEVFAIFVTMKNQSEALIIAEKRLNFQ